MINYSELKNNFFVMAGPNVIESEDHVIKMARAIKKIMDKFNVIYIFKCSFDKANRSSASSYRGVGLEKGLKILKRVREEVGVPVITDIHESWQAPVVAEVVDIIQIPAFLCRQTDLLKAAAETGKIIHVKKAQFAPASVMHKCKEKLIAFGNDKVILCERGSMYGFQDLVVDPRSLVWLKSDTNLVSMDITHCLQQPAQIQPDGTIKAGGLREFIPLMGKLAVTFGVNGIFMEVHDNPDKSLCDAPTQFPLVELESFIEKLVKLRNFNIQLEQKQTFEKKVFNKKVFNKKICFIPARYPSTRLPGKPLLKINNKTIIHRVYEQVQKCSLVDEIIILTDDTRIKKEVESFGGRCELVLEECLNGTERIIKYILKDSNCCDLVINVQGDEPFIDPEAIDKCISNYIKQINQDIKCSTLHHKLTHEENIRNRSNGKLVLDKNNNIMYCSRNIIPGQKGKEYNEDINYYGHIGIFVFDKDYLLNEYINENTPNQLSEDIEWLKILEQGYKINSVCVENPEISVDTKADYEYLVDKYK